MLYVKKLARNLTIALTVAGLTFGIVNLSGALQGPNVLIADSSGQHGDYDPG